MIPKYRAWDKETKAMNGMAEIYRNRNQEIELRPRDGNIILMQSTGLKDKNGQEIFEGDIVKRDGIKKPEVVRFGEWIDVDTLGFEEQYIGFYFESEHEGQKRLYSVESQFNNLSKVIGNIYKNPELLEVE